MSKVAQRVLDVRSGVVDKRSVFKLHSSGTANES